MKKAPLLRRAALKSEQIDKRKEDNRHHEIPKRDPLYLPLYSNRFN